MKVGKAIDISKLTHILTICGHRKREIDNNEPSILYKDLLKRLELVTHLSGIAGADITFS